MKPLIALATLLATLALIPCTMGDYWSGYVKTDTSTWSIYRQSDNISFNLSSAVEGDVTSVEFRGRRLTPYQSYYAEVQENDVRLSQRTNALDGHYKSDDIIRLRSSNTGETDISYAKPYATNEWVFSFKEQWPVLLISSRIIEYSGQRINNRDFEINNKDFVGLKVLYSTNLSMDNKAVMWLNRLNATVLATDDAILLAELQPQKYLGHQVNMHSTGIADLTYSQKNSQYDAKSRDYPVINEGNDRYYGDYEVARRIEMSSIFEEFNDTYDVDGQPRGWLPCCESGWNGMANLDQRDFGADARRIFDCSCYKNQIDLD